MKINILIRQQPKSVGSQEDVQQFFIDALRVLEEGGIEPYLIFEGDCSRCEDLLPETDILITDTRDKGLALAEKAVEKGLPVIVTTTVSSAQPPPQHWIFQQRWVELMFNPPTLGSTGDVEHLQESVRKFSILVGMKRCRALQPA